MSARARTLGEIAEWVGGELAGPADRAVRGVAAITEAGPEDLTFVSNPKYQKAVAGTKAAGVLVAPDLPVPEGIAVIRVADPYGALARVLNLFDPGRPVVAPGVDPAAHVDPAAELAAEVCIGPGAFVGAGARLGARTSLAAGSHVEEGATLGAGCYLFPGAYVGRGCTLGDRVVLWPGVIVGADGFGYAPVDGRYEKIPQLGSVVIEDDVEIGPNTTVDRGTLGETRIGRGTKIDNLVMIAHNVAISSDGVIAAQTGLSGSTTIGKRVRMGGRSGSTGHLRIGDDVTVAGVGVVAKDVPDGQTVAGFPARPLREYLKSEALVRRIPKLEERIRVLEKALRDAEEEAP